jgi:hypothetical protein
MAEAAALPLPLLPFRGGGGSSGGDGSGEGGSAATAPPPPPFAAYVRLTPELRAALLAHAGAPGGAAVTFNAAGAPSVRCAGAWRALWQEPSARATTDR